MKFPFSSTEKLFWNRFVKPFSSSPEGRFGIPLALPLQVGRVPVATGEDADAGVVGTDFVDVNRAIGEGVLAPDAVGVGSDLVDVNRATGEGVLGVNLEVCVMDVCVVREVCISWGFRRPAIAVFSWAV